MYVLFSNNPANLVVSNYLPHINNHMHVLYTKEYCLRYIRLILLEKVILNREKFNALTSVIYTGLYPQ